jgi:hypothetical protein
MRYFCGLKIGILVDDGFEQTELAETRKALGQAGAAAMTEILDKPIWKPYLDHVSKTIATGKQVLIEVASLALGDQIEAEWVPLLGIVYDPKNDLVELALVDRFTTSLR